MFKRFIIDKELSKNPHFVIAPILILVIVVAYFVLPSLGSQTFASPDETAVALAAQRFAQAEGVRVSMPLAITYPWLHPRSWVSQGDALVPVGFLGWPILLAPFIFVFSAGVLPWIGGVLMLSALFPLFRLLRSHFSLIASSIGVGVMAMSPITILYANRGLFPNVALMVLGLWSIWAIQEASIKRKRWWLVGLLCALAITIRPIESVWIVPWWIWALKRTGVKYHYKMALTCAIGFFLGCLPFLVSNHFTYGHWWNIGYWLRDNSLNIDMNTLSIHQEKSSWALTNFLPFGFHPRHVWWNIQSFTREFMWPSLVLVLSALWLWGRDGQRVAIDKKLERKKEYNFLFVSAWTAIFLLSIYGSGMYQDHIQMGAVTVANSFLRYIFPLVPLVAVAGAYLYERVTFFSNWTKMGVMCFFLVYAGWGIFGSFFKDDEGIWTTRQELKKYEMVARKAAEYFPPESIILSERSDKIFVPIVGLRSVSPLPPLSESARLIHDTSQQVKVGLYARPLSQRQKDSWREQGVEVDELASFGRERLYRLRPR